MAQSPTTTENREDRPKRWAVVASRTAGHLRESLGSMIAAAEECGAAERQSALAWAASYMRTERGQPLDFDSHPFMCEPLLLRDTPRIGIMSASQVGKTTLAICRVFWLADTKPGFRCIYTMHTETEVMAFSAARAKLALDSSPYLSRRVRGINSKEIKAFPHRRGTSIIRFKGASADSQALSEPADLVVHDELDYSRPDVLDLYEQRLAHSAYGWRMVIGTPTVPRYGMDRLWRRSTQGEWYVSCSECRWEGPLQWPDNVGRETYLCPRGHPIGWEQIQAGRWVHAQPDAEWRMYHLSRMLLPGWTADRIWAAYEGRSVAGAGEPEGEIADPQLFYNHVLGLPATSGELLVDEEIVSRLLGRTERCEIHDGPCFAGVDVGQILHICIGHQAPDGTRLYHWVGETDWANLDQLLKLHNVRVCVIDALPETTMAQALARTFRRRVLLAYYTTQPIKGGEPIKADWGQSRVDLDRTVVLDRSAERLIMERDVFCPLPHEQRKQFVEQMTAMARATEQDAQNRPRVVWQQTGPDHYRHAHSYATVAADLMAGMGSSVTILRQGGPVIGSQFRSPNGQQVGMRHEEEPPMLDQYGQPVDPAEIRRRRRQQPPLPR